MKQEEKPIPLSQDTLKFLSELEGYGISNYMFNIPRDTAEFIFRLLKGRDPYRVLEIGTSNGYSTCWMSLACPDAKITTIEKDTKKIKLAQENFKKLKLNNIEILEGNALEVLQGLKEKFDFVFIDGTKGEYVEYLKALNKKLNKDAIIVADNIHSHNIVDYVEMAKARYNSTTVKIGTGLEVSYV
ncbi:class I SAM-dependent methyltransferase [Candidatus Woesearchaeota archaeon]|nr:class I SAM-dependent methyltransferase [Candidatus Woesearchaeota archaeon]